MQTIRVKHNFEAAHRLSLLPGKCANIHGHSFWATLEIGGAVTDSGILLDFESVKTEFRYLLDSTFDHKLILNRNDNIVSSPSVPIDIAWMQGDPTTENLAKYVGEAMRVKFGLDYQYRVILWETAVNCATWEG